MSELHACTCGPCTPACPLCVCLVCVLNPCARTHSDSCVHLYSYACTGDSVGGLPSADRRRPGDARAFGVPRTDMSDISVHVRYVMRRKREPPTSSSFVYNLTTKSFCECHTQGVFVGPALDRVCDCDDHRLWRLCRGHSYRASCLLRPDG